MSNVASNDRELS